MFYTGAGAARKQSGLPVCLRRVFVVRWRQCTEICGTTGLWVTHIYITSNRQRAKEEPIVKNNEPQRMFCALEVLIFNVNFMLFLFPMNSAVTHLPIPAHSSNLVISI